MKKQSNKQTNSKAKVRNKKVSSKIDEGYLNDLNLKQAVKLLEDSLSNIRLIIYIIYKEELWIGHHESFVIFIDKVLNNLCSKSSVYRNIKAAEIDLVLGYPIGTVPITIAEVLADKSLSPNLIKKTWRLAQENSNNKTPTITVIKECIQTHKSSKAAYKWVTKPTKWDHLLTNMSQKERAKFKDSLTHLINAV